MDILDGLQSEIANYADSSKAKVLIRFFKTGPGEYGEGDKFLGIVVPNCRKVVKKYYHVISLGDTEKLLRSEWHEERLVALLILVEKFDKGSESVRSQIYDIYLANTKYINNWDLVDLSSPKIVGRYLYNNPSLRTKLDELAESKLLWDKRIAVISTMYFIHKLESEVAFRIVKKLLSDEHDLIQKANGWMLREIGKKIDPQLLIDFLKDNYYKIPRTTLRYAIERFSPEARQRYLVGFD